MTRIVGKCVYRNEIRCYTMMMEFSGIYLTHAIELAKHIKSGPGRKCRHNCGYDQRVEFPDRNVRPSRLRQLMVSENVVDRKIVKKQTDKSSDQLCC